MLLILCPVPNRFTELSYFLILAPPATLASSRRWFIHREKAHVQHEVNKRKNLIRRDKLLRHGEEEVQRRSQFTDW